ncbi:MAG: hypothetical protein KF735_08530 [Chelatococcus sp.]|uniref:hypothetical protein n=1 Tax=Chelatococcus sp. TaxID=1953771 RepID=UPI0025BE6792|nr:hypothetical protein [Chelatococcus sp.]MBX3537669.1 hypothetical protein [Chelatococcus sp.]
MQNALSAASASPAKHNEATLWDGRPELREVIHEYLALAALQAGLACTFAEIADDQGLEYALRRFRAYAVAAIDTYKQLREASPPKGDA